MQTPVRTVQIKGMPRVANPKVELQEAAFEVSTLGGPDGARLTKQVSTEQLKEVFGGGGATNDVVGGPKSVIFLTHEDAVAAGRPTDLSLDQIPQNTITGGNLAYVDLPTNGQHHYIAKYDGSATPQLRTFIDGRGVPDFNRSPQDGLVPLHWLPVNSPAAGVPAYPQLPSGYVFTAGELVRAFVPDAASEQFFAAISGGPHPAPTSAGGDGNWRVVAEQDVPAPGPGGNNGYLLTGAALLSNTSAGAGISLTRAADGSMRITNTSASVARPFAPTNGVVNDTLKEFTFKVTPAYPNYLQYKEGGRPGTTVAAFLSPATAYQVGDTVHVTGLAGAPKNSLAYYVGGSGNIPDGAVLTNSEAFSGTPTGASVGTQVDLLGLTNAQMLQVMSLDFDDNNDTELGAAPAWSRFGMSFDAQDANGDAWRYYVGRGTYKPYSSNDDGEGVDPRWSRITKSPL